MVKSVIRLAASVAMVIMAVGTSTNVQRVASAPVSDQDLTPQAPAGKMYYVSPEGDDANPGTEAQPFRTLGKAAGLVTAGETVLIHAGTYPELVKPRNSGAPGQYITYKNYGDGEVIIEAENGTRAACIEVDGQSFLHFNGLTVRGANGDVSPHAGIAITNGSSYIVVDNVTAYDNYFGIIADGEYYPVSYITVTNSRTFNPLTRVGNLHYGIFFYQKVYDSRIINNRAAYSLPTRLSFGIEIGTDYPGYQADGPRRILVLGNEVDHNESQGIRTWNAVGVLISGNYAHHNGATGIQIENGSENIVVDNNLSEYNAQSYEYETGVWVDGSKNVLVRNNILRKNKIGLNITESDRVIAHDNYIYLNDRGAEHLLNASGLVVNRSASNVAITQNTLYGNSAIGAQLAEVSFKNVATGIKFINNIVSGSASQEDFLNKESVLVSDYNDFFNIRPLAVNWSGKTVPWEAYLAASQQDAHSLTAEPRFYNPATYDFRLRADSPLLGRGAILAFTTDSGSGNSISVTDASYFSDGFGVGRGDHIMIGTAHVLITAVDYAQNLITVDREITWNSGAPVSFPFTGRAPTPGAVGTAP